MENGDGNKQKAGTDMQLQKIGTLIREGRIQKGMNQTELAELLQVSVAAVSKWETGKNIPDMSNIERIAQILDISVQELLGIPVPADAAASANAKDKSEVSSESGAESKPEASSEIGEKSKIEESSEAAPVSDAAISRKISLKMVLCWILLAILAGFSTGGILFRKYAAPAEQPEITIVTDFYEDTVYGSTCNVVLEYDGEITDNFLHEQAVVFRKKNPKYFKGVDAVLLLYYKEYDASRDGQGTADFMLLILK